MFLRISNASVIAVHVGTRLYVVLFPFVCRIVFVFGHMLWINQRRVLWQRKRVGEAALLRGAAVLNSIALKQACAKTFSANPVSPLSF